jgi:hypothetical protein
MRKDYLAHSIYGLPPPARLRRKHLSCGHGRDRAIVGRHQVAAWCWRCDGHVRMVRIPRLWKRLTFLRR